MYMYMYILHNMIDSNARHIRVTYLDPCHFTCHLRNHAGPAGFPAGIGTSTCLLSPRSSSQKRHEDPTLAVLAISRPTNATKQPPQLTRLTQAWHVARKKQHYTRTMCHGHTQHATRNQQQVARQHAASDMRHATCSTRRSARNAHHTGEPTQGRQRVHARARAHP